MDEPATGLRWAADPCTCSGCWNCPGRVVGCLCDTDPDEVLDA